MNLWRRLDKLERARAAQSVPLDPMPVERKREELVRILRWAYRELAKPPSERFCKDQLQQVFRGMHQWVTEQERPGPERERKLACLERAMKEANR